MKLQIKALCTFWGILVLKPELLVHTCVEATASVSQEWFPAIAVVVALVFHILNIGEIISCLKYYSTFV